MAQYIIHHEGVYNVYSTVTEGPLYKKGLTREQVVFHFKEEGGRQALLGLEDRIERAKASGCSATGLRLDDIVQAHSLQMTREAFIRQFLTLPTAAENTADEGAEPRSDFDKWFYSARSTNCEIDGVLVPISTELLYKTCNGYGDKFERLLEVLEEAFNAGKAAK